MASSVIDLDELLERVGGDREIVGELIEIFLEDAPALVAELQHAGDDMLRLQKAAHTLKGASGNMGAHGARDAAERLQAAAAARDVAAAGRERQTLLLEMERVTSTLVEWHRAGAGSAA